MKRDKIIYYVATGLLTLLMLFSVSMYLFNNAEIASVFNHLGYPEYLVYPLAVAKLLGLFALWNPKFEKLKEWAEGK